LGLKDFTGLITTSELHDGQTNISQPVQAKQLLQDFSASRFENRKPHDSQV